MAPLDAGFRDRAVYLPAADALVLADLHVGRDASSNVELSLGERDDLRSRIERLLSTFDPRTVVVAGDALHSFDSLPRGVEETFEDVAAAVDDAGADLRIAAGNHDTMLETVVEGPAGDTVGSVADEQRLPDADAVVLHGHEPPSVGAALYVCGHDHPAIRIEGQRRPCYLFGPGVRGGADVLMLPAFNRLAPGSVVNRARRHQFQSPLVDRPGAFRPVVRDGDAAETYWFPPLDEFRAML